MDLDDLAAMPQTIPASFNAAEAPNHEEIEQQFAVVCAEQAETYWKLITQIKPSTLHRLTKWDDDIMTAFEAAFPEIANNNDRLKKISEEEMKSADGKARWRAFMEPFEKVVDDYNFGTMLRADCNDEYTEKNSIFALRLQFYAIEIARNRKGLNDYVWSQAQKSKAT